MKIRGNKIEIVQGETFTLDKLIVNEDGSPLVVSKEIPDPHILITISNSKYNVPGRYVKNYWFPIDFVFDETRPVDLRTLLTGSGGTAQYDSFPDELTLDKDGYFISGYIAERNDFTSFKPNDAVFYLENSDETKTYKYWKPEETSGKWLDYEFAITALFTSSDTKNWTPQTYYWSVQIVSRQNAEEMNTYDTTMLIMSDGEIIVNSNLKGV